MSFLQGYGAVVALVLAFVTTFSIASMILSNRSIVGPVWSTGLVLSNWVAFAFCPDRFQARR